MRLLNFIVIRLSLFFVLGTLIGFYFNLDSYTQVITLAASFAFLLLYYILQYNSLHPQYTFSLLAYVITIQIGCLNASIQLPENQDNHYIHQVQPETQNMLIEIIETQKENDFNYKYIAEVHQLDHQECFGKCLIQLKKDSLTVPFEPGEWYLTNSSIKDFNPPKNPTSFGYKRFMKNRSIYKQTYITAETSKKITHNQTQKLSTWAHQQRSRIKDSLATNGFLKKESGLIQALILGQKEDIDPATYQDFSKAGVVHILAVSGLHVGIVLLLLQYVFRPIEWFPYGKIIKTLLVIAFMWLFALMAGFSPSVTRAVTMFSLFAIAINMKRKTNTINVLCISLLILLLIHPQRIFEVGFQLSYCAVFAIVTMQPPLFKLWQPHLKPVKYLWSIASVTITAQLGVLPLSLYYFKQFPGLFMLANIVIIPLLGVLLAMGILVVLLSLAGWLPDILQIYFSKILHFLTLLVNKIASQEQFVIENILFDNWMFISLSFAVFFIIMSFRKPKFGNLAPMLLGLTSFFLASSFHLTNQKQYQEFIVFDQPRKTVLGRQLAGNFLVYSDQDNTDLSDNYAVKNFEKLQGLKRLKFNRSQNIYRLENEFILVVDEKEIYEIPHLNKPVVILTNSPKINLDRLIETLEPSLIIADANNYKSFVSLWKASCKKYQIDFHYTYEDGAWRKKW